MQGAGSFVVLLIALALVLPLSGTDQLRLVLGRTTTVNAEVMRVDQRESTGRGHGTYDELTLQWTDATGSHHGFAETGDLSTHVGEVISAQAGPGASDITLDSYGVALLMVLILLLLMALAVFGAWWCIRRAGRWSRLKGRLSQVEPVCLVLGMETERFKQPNKKDKKLTREFEYLADEAVDKIPVITAFARTDGSRLRSGDAVQVFAARDRGRGPFAMFDTAAGRWFLGDGHPLVSPDQE